MANGTDVHGPWLVPKISGLMGPRFCAASTYRPPGTGLGTAVGLGRGVALGGTVALGTGVAVGGAAVWVAVTVSGSGVAVGGAAHAANASTKTSPAARARARP